MIDMQNFMKRPDSFDMKIAMVNGSPVCIFRDCHLDKPGMEMVFPNAPVVTSPLDAWDLALREDEDKY
jgi:hypothetical protein